MVKKDDLSSAYEACSDFYKFTRNDDCTIESYILEFLKRYKTVKKFKIVIPNCVLAFILLDCAGLVHRDKQLVLTAVNFEELDLLLDQMGAALKKYFKAQGASANLGDTNSSTILVVIK